jgi:3-phenylpropionate/trans-cinnamate dioxygenase ferredoxin subunit
MGDIKIQASKNGPFIVQGGAEIIDDQGKAYPAQQTAALCRCGASQKKPFCDGSHRKINFQS